MTKIRFSSCRGAEIFETKAPDEEAERREKALYEKIGRLDGFGHRPQPPFPGKSELAYIKGKLVPHLSVLDVRHLNSRINPGPAAR